MKKIMKAVGLILLLLVIYFVAQSFAAAMLAIIHGVLITLSTVQSGAQPDVQQFTRDLLSYINTQTSWIILIAVAISVPTFYIIYRNRKHELMTFVSMKSISPLSIPILIIFGLSLNFVLEMLLYFVSQLSFLSKVFETYNQLAGVLFSGNLVVSLIAVGIVGPIFEELLFRGLIFGELRKISKVHVAILIQALIFGVYHMNVVQGSYAFLIGILLGFIYYRSNSIITSIIIHITINSSSVILPQLISDSQFDSWSGTIAVASLILIFASGAFILISRSFKRSMDNSLYEMNREPKIQPSGDNWQ